jgi:formamidopyrimidine-DNA glycosylase
MPELCEVQIMTENLERWTKGKRLERFEILDAKFNAVETPFVGQMVGRCFRRAKYTIQEVGESSVILHFRMTGKVVLEDTPRKYVRVRWHLSDGRTVAFVDPRRFGECHTMPSKKVDDYFNSKGLGPEPWPDKRSGDWWRQQFGRVNNPIKVALLRQECVAGLGNILASEICYRAKVHPEKKVQQLTQANWNEISSAAHKTIEAILLEERQEEINYVNAGNQLPNSFWVYSREGEKCRVCRDPILRIKQNSRSTFYCESCQK